MKISEQLKKFLGHAVELVDSHNRTYQGWLIKEGRFYNLYPLGDIWHIYTYLASHIKTIKFLTNGYKERIL